MGLDPSEMKPWSLAYEMIAPSYLPHVVRQACEKFEKFHRLDPGVACAEMIDAESSFTVPGWATAQVATWSMINSERRA